MAKSYYERTVKLFEEQDCLVEKVEHYNAFAGRRKDLFGFLDAVALHPLFGTIGVQVCGPGDFAAHERKILEARREQLIFWILGGNRCILIGWRQLKQGPNKKNEWTPRIREFTTEDLPEITADAVRVMRRRVGHDCPLWLLPPNGAPCVSVG